MPDVNDLIWVLLRILNRDLLPIPCPLESDPQIPLWTRFNKALTPTAVTYTSVAYTPTVQAKPSNTATVYTTIIRCKEMTNALGQKYNVQTMDQQLYVVAQHMKWHLPEKFKDHIL